MSLIPTLLMGIWRVSAWPCTSSTVLARGFLEGTATFIFTSCWSDQAQDGAETAYLKNFRPFDRIWLEVPGAADRQAELLKLDALSHRRRAKPVHGLLRPRAPAFRMRDASILELAIWLLPVPKRWGRWVWRGPRRRRWFCRFLPFSPRRRECRLEFETQVRCLARIRPTRPNRRCASRASIPLPSRHSRGSERRS